MDEFMHVAEIASLRTMQKKSETASLVRKLPRRVPLYFCMARSYANFPFTKL